MYTGKGTRHQKESSRPNNTKLILQIQQERDFLMAKTANKGRGYDIIKISQLPDEHFKQTIETRKK